VHSIQLCVRDGLGKATHVPKVFVKCKALAKAAHKSSKIADLLETLKRSINKMNLTRWNSEYLLIKSILSVGAADLESIGALMENPIRFTKNDLVILEEIISILEPFYDISVQCQAESAVSVSLVVPSISYLLCHLSDLKQNITVCVKMVDQLHVSIETRFAGIVKRLYQQMVKEDDPFRDPLYFMAAVLDPQFKLYWIRDMKFAANVENHLKQTIIQLIIDEISKNLDIAPTKPPATTQFNPTRTLCSLTPEPKRRNIFHYPESIDGMNMLDPTIEIQAYLHDPVQSKFSDYWFHSQLLLLRKLVMKIFSVEASSAPVERVFFYAGMILLARRTKMSEKLFKGLVFLRVNQTLL
jgi:hypothetical protein